MKELLNRNLDRIGYLMLLISIYSGIALVKLFTLFPFLIPDRRKKRDIIMFPYVQNGSDGYMRRFEQYFRFFENEGTSYKVCDVCSQDYAMQCENGSARERYWLYHMVLWKRIMQVISARNYKSAFIHRGLYPYYPDQKRPYLQKLLRKLNNNITVDYFDSVYMYHPILIRETVENSDKVTVVNKYLADNYFNKHHHHVFILPISVKLENYKLKDNYEVGDSLKLVWTGYSDNLKNEVIPLKSVLQKLSKKYPIELMLICGETVEIEGVKISQQPWDENTFHDLLSSADIGIYPSEHSEYNRGKMAAKVLDFMAAGLPVVGSSHGLPPDVVDKENIMIACNDEEWESSLTTLYNNPDLRKKIGQNGRKMVEQSYSTESSYKLFKKIIAFDPDSQADADYSQSVTSIKSKKKVSFVGKNIDRLYYLVLIFSLRLGYIITTILTKLHFLIPKRKKKDILLFPYYPKNSVGSILRFEVYLKLFEQDNLSYDIEYTGENTQDYNPGYFVESSNMRRKYVVYMEIFWKRLFAVLKAGNYKAVFIQRSLFPLYPDQDFPYLERLIRKLNDNITFDFYDADYAVSRTSIHLSTRYCNKITVANEYLQSYYNKLHKNVRVVPISLNLRNYMVKTNYVIKDKVKIFWTGNMGNFEYLCNILPPLEEVFQQYSCEIILITPEKVKLNNLNVIWHPFEKKTFFKLLNSADIGICPKQDAEVNRGGMAMKGLEYMATGLPIIASSWSISPHLIPGEDVLTPESNEEWKQCLESLINNEERRKKLGVNAHSKFIKYHSHTGSYPLLKDIIFDNQEI